MAGLLAVGVLAMDAGCTPSRREIETDMVRRIRFDGNGGLVSGHNDLQLRGPMEQRQSPLLSLTFPFMYFATPAALSLESIQADARRLEVWYAHHGWFDARFEGWEIRRVRKRWPEQRRAGVVDLIGHVVPGRPSFLTRFDVEGQKVSGSGQVIRTALRKSGVAEEDQFNLDALRGAERLIVESLQDDGYAYAKTELHVDAYPEQESVEVDLSVEPGISSTFGEVRVTGLERVPETQVKGVLRIFAGNQFDLKTLRQAQSRLFETGLFSLVDIQPDLSNEQSREVPIDVSLTEAKFRRFRFGVGVSFDYFNVQPKLLLRFRDNRLFGSGVQMEAQAGVGGIIGVVRDDEAPGADLLITGLGSLRFEYPWLVGARLSVEFGGSFRQDAQFGTLPFRKAAADIGLRYRFSDAVSVSGGPAFEYFNYLEPSQETLDAARLQFGGDFSGAEYRLLAFDVRLRADFRDDPIRTQRGTFWGLDVRQSIPIPSFDGQADSGTPDNGFLYTKAEGEVRGFFKPRPLKNGATVPLVFGARLHAAALLPWSDGGALPYPDLAFLGGPNSLRGFRSNQVGPYDTVCSYGGGRPNPQHNNGQYYEVTRTYLPRGGAFAADAMAEIRYDWKYGVSFAVFGDAGLLARRWPDVGADKIRGGAGLGLRYDSPVGPIRLDLGFRPVFPEDLRSASYIGCNPIDRLPRGYDLLTGGIGVREQLAGRAFPMALNLFLAIGEAF